MGDPVVLIGTRKDGGSLGAVGLYADADEAKFAVLSGELPSDCYYSVMTPKIGETIVPRVPSDVGGNQPLLSSKSLLSNGFVIESTGQNTGQGIGK